MANLHLGDSVTFRGCAYFVRGMTPMGAKSRRVQLEDAETGEHIEACIDDVQNDALARRAPAPPRRPA